MNQPEVTNEQKIQLMTRLLQGDAFTARRTMEDIVNQMTKDINVSVCAEVVELCRKTLEEGDVRPGCDEYAQVILQLCGHLRDFLKSLVQVKGICEELEAKGILHPEDI